MEYSRKNMNWWPESFHPSANSDTNCIHSISFHSSNRVLLCLNWVGRWVRWWSVQKTERKQASYFVKLKLKLLQYSGHLTREPTRWERVRAGREVGGRGWDGWMASPTQRTWVWASSGVGDRQRSLVCYSLLGHKELDTTVQLNWVELKLQVQDRNISVPKL